MPIIDNILEMLQNGEWHYLKEISEKTQLDEFKVKLLTSFLAEYHFIELDRKEQRTRLTRPLLSFLKKIQGMEN